MKLHTKIFLFRSAPLHYYPVIPSIMNQDRLHLIRINSVGGLIMKIRKLISFIKTSVFWTVGCNTYKILILASFTIFTHQNEALAILSLRAHKFRKPRNPGRLTSLEILLQNLNNSLWEKEWKLYVSVNDHDWKIFLCWLLKSIQLSSLTSCFKKEHLHRERKYIAFIKNGCWF